MTDKELKKALEERIRLNLGEMQRVLRLLAKENQLLGRDKLSEFGLALADYAKLIEDVMAGKKDN